MAFDQARGNLVIFGGTSNFPPYQSGTRSANTLIWSRGADTIKLDSPTVSPPAREAPGMVYDPSDQTVLLFGGRSDAGDENDTWIWDGSGWTERHPAHAPTPRSEANLIYDPVTARVVLFGGITDTDGYQNDTWAWDGIDWIQLNLSHPPQLSQNSQAMAYSAADHEIILLATAADGTPQTYEFDGTDWSTTLTPAPGSSFGTMSSYYGGTILFQYPGSLWQWDGSWHTLPIAGCGPQTRRLATSAFDPLGGELLIFGGLSYDASQGYGDLWGWTADSGWRQIA
jgi:hypothetical protein